ncbi:coiled-coil domain-containing protein 190 [Eleutherodactylus coqui]|uniref:Uncharacterized protein n=1 Tax=Eleutherodactylus coqui TaxID=57060 RepID=A0A8J6KC81_ELECQ|nr:hypothetical protein GDO78_009356 [Eleutherodactylus coqui]
MQRSRHLGNNMDKQWEAERRGARRAEARLSNGIQEIEDAEHYQMSSMTKEKKQVQKDLIRIQQANVKKTSNLKNDHKTEILQTQAKSSGKRGQQAASPEGPVMASGSSMTLQMRINDFIDGVKKGKPENFQRNGTELSFSETNITDNKTAPSRRSSIVSIAEDTMSKKDLPGKPSGLASVSSNPQFLRQRRGSFFKDKVSLDQEIYAPDGRLRTLHTIPGFKDSLEEAGKARYIRHRVKPENEKELSVGEIFQKEDSSIFPEDKTSEMENTRETTKKRSL